MKRAFRILLLALSQSLIIIGSVLEKFVAKPLLWFSKKCIKIEQNDAYQKAGHNQQQVSKQNK